jgi:predicted nuclease of restriction endonuclease-like (RecB) superfamily
LRPIGHALSDQLKETPLNRLTWTHIRQILRVPTKEAQLWYLQETAQQNWSVRTLDRNIATLYYQRLISSQKKEIVEHEMKEKTAQFIDLVFYNFILKCFVIVELKTNKFRLE